MSKYEEALNKIGKVNVELVCLYSAVNEFLKTKGAKKRELQFMFDACDTNVNIISCVKVLKEAISKAEKYDELKNQISATVDIENGTTTICTDVVLQKPIYDNLIKERDEALKRIAELEDKCNMHDFFWESCGFKKLGFKNSIQVKDYINKLRTENKVLKNGIKSLKSILKMKARPMNRLNNKS